MTSVNALLRQKIDAVHQRLHARASAAGAPSAAFSAVLRRASERIETTAAQQFAMPAAPETAAPYAPVSAAAVRREPVSSGADGRYEGIIRDAAQAYGLDEALIKAVIRAESSFNPNAVSSAGAQGLMQLMPGTARELKVQDAFDPRQNIMGGAAYLKKQMDRFGDVRLALAAYNTGPGRVASLGISDVNDAAEYEKISSGVRGYVGKVLGYYAGYKGLA